MAATEAGRPGPLEVTDVSRRRWVMTMGVGAAVALALGLGVRAVLSTGPSPSPEPVATPVAVVEPSPAVEPEPTPAPAVVAEAPREVAVQPRKLKASKGKLLVRVNPWADVVVDGRMVGATPLSAIEVSAGRHSVTVTNSELGKTRTVAVDVRPNRQELVEINLK
jgi:serine/threonine-protein kinase